MGWVANALLIVGWAMFPTRPKAGVAIQLGGSILWAYIGYSLAMWDLCSIEVIIAILKVRALALMVPAGPLRI